MNGSLQNLMFPHPWGFVGDIYKTSCEVKGLQLEEKKNPDPDQKKTGLMVLLLDMTSYLYGNFGNRDGHLVFTDLLVRALQLSEHPTAHIPILYTVPKD